jgi:hypothetical protein
MLPFLQPIKEAPYDCLYFLPKEESMHVEAALYKEPGEKIGGSDIGDLYHVLLFREGMEGFEEVDKFEAIFGCPLEYMSNLIPSGWYGVFARKTTTSDEFFDELCGLLLEP